MNTTLVLVHGAFAGKYAWELVTPLLENAGRRVITLDLPGHGDDATPPGKVTFDDYLNAVGTCLAAESGPVTLVGHSMAGMVISAVAEKMPERLDKLVYLSAYLPQNGESLQELGGKDAESLIAPNLQFAPDYASASLSDEVVVRVFADDCPDEIKRLVVEKNNPEPLAAFQTKVALSEAQFGRVPKYYIETLQDRGVGNALQRQMVAANGQVARVFSLDCGHSAYFAKPADLAELLRKL